MGAIFDFFKAPSEAFQSSNLKEVESAEVKPSFIGNFFRECKTAAVELKDKALAALGIGTLLSLAGSVPAHAAGVLGTIPAVDMTDFGAAAIIVIGAIATVAGVKLAIKAFKGI